MSVYGSSQGGDSCTEYDADSPISNLNTHSTSKSSSAALVKAAAAGSLEEVSRVLEASSSDILSKKWRGTTALHEACKNGHLLVVAEIMRRGSCTKLLNRNGCTPLHFAALCKDKAQGLEVSRLLLESGSSVNVTNQRLDTPLHFAAYCRPTACDAELVRELVAARANVDAKNLNADTPLMNAVTMSNLDIVTALADADADLNARNNLDKSASDLAAKSGALEIAQALEKLRDPLSRLSDVTRQMKVSIAQMTTTDALQQEVKILSERCRAYEAVATMACSRLGPSGNTSAVEHAMSTVRWIAGLPATTPAVVVQPHLLQALIMIKLLCNQPGAARSLCDLNVADIFPTLEQLVTRHCLRCDDMLMEIRCVLQDAQKYHDRSESSTPMSFGSYHSHRTSTHSWQSAVPSGHRSETSRTSPPVHDGGVDASHFRMLQDTIGEATPKRLRARSNAPHVTVTHPGATEGFEVPIQTDDEAESGDMLGDSFISKPQSQSERTPRESPPVTMNQLVPTIDAAAAARVISEPNGRSRSVTCSVS